mmetsp:Transcript_11636/g.16214  ORF Transcript_11636/g.16214 Transcript_11636/m.16214 type:complete len:465 (+) Transcript_11636:269-1663(+)
MGKKRGGRRSERQSSTARSEGEKQDEGGSESGSYISNRTWEEEHDQLDEENGIPPMSGAHSPLPRSRAQRSGSGEKDDTLADILEALAEKRSTTREEQLGVLYEHMLAAPSAEGVYAARAEILERLLASLGKGGAEAVLACRAAGAFCVVLGPDEQEVFRALRRRLERLVTRGEDDEARTAAIRALAVGCFICSSVHHDTLELLELFVDLLQGTSQGEPLMDESVPAALEAWGLLATTAGEEYMQETGGPVVVPLCLEQLQGGGAGVETRMAAAEVLALVYEALHPKEEEPDPEDWRAEQARRRAVAAGELVEEVPEEDPFMAEQWAEAVGVLGRLQAESSKRVSKRDRKEQRSVVRDVRAFLEDGETPEETISFQGGSITVTSWERFCQVNALRAACRGGFQNQLQTNAVVQEILAEDYAAAHSAVDKKAYYAKSSSMNKERTQHRRGARQRRQAAQQAFLDG